MISGIDIWADFHMPFRNQSCNFRTVKNSLSFDVATTGEFTTAKPIPGSRKILLQTKTSKDILVFDTDVNDIVPEETIVSPVPGK